MQVSVLEKAPQLTVPGVASGGGCRFWLAVVPPPGFQD